MKRYCATSAVSNASGQATASIIIPEDFDINIPRRYIESIHVWWENPLPGDRISGINLVDRDGVIPASGQSSMPGYPIVSTWIDMCVSLENQKFYLEPGLTVIDPPSSKNDLLGKLHLEIAAQKAGQIIDTLYANIIWSDIT